MIQSYEFFMNHDVTEYNDEWVAVSNDRVLSHGKKVKKVLEEAEDKAKGEKFLLTRVPGKETMIL